MIAVNPSGTPATDYAIMKQIHQLRASQQAPDAIVWLRPGVNLRPMQAGEHLFIVSHGNADTGELRNVATNRLIEWLNSGTGPPENFGKIVLLSCYGGVPKSGPALAQQIAANFRHRGHDVEGATGFSFGTSEFSRSGHSSVLSEDLRVFYALDDTDAMAAMWAGRNPTHGAGVLATEFGGGHINQFATIRQYVQGKVETKSVDSRIRGLVDRFRQRATAIEQGLGTALGQTAGATVEAKIATLEAVPPHGAVPAHVTTWNNLLAEQYQLFEDYYLWTDPDTAFNTFPS